MSNSLWSQQICSRPGIAALGYILFHWTVVLSAVRALLGQEHTALCCASVAADVAELLWRITHVCSHRLCLSCCCRCQLRLSTRRFTGHWKVGYRVDMNWFVIYFLDGKVTSNATISTCSCSKCLRKIYLYLISWFYHLQFQPRYWQR